jgi:3-deoxy-D-manno-octulosonate 8-phosphate phosphatase (KDO 8-P phosphatase)
MTFHERCQSIQLILSDVDGVMTDGGLIFDDQGLELKRFHVRDGMGIKLWQRAGHQFGLVTSRTSHIVEVRAAELGIEIVRQGFPEKLPVVREIVGTLGLSLDQVAFIGDDFSDLAAIHAVGLGIAVADAADEIRAAADHTTQLRGGDGAVREVVETILKSQKRWEDVVRQYE